MILVFHVPPPASSQALCSINRAQFKVTKKTFLREVIKKLEVLAHRNWTDNSSFPI